MNDKYAFEENDLLWYWFVNISGVGPVARRKLIQFFGHPRQMYYARDDQFAGILTRKQQAALKYSKDWERLKEGLVRLREDNSRFIHWESEDYPEKLKHIPDPPYGFYLKGRLPDPDLPSLAMVGSRRATEYGKRIAMEFAERLAGAGVQIISGLAEGIDTASHRGAIRSHGYTLGLLGGGIDTIYPMENFNLYLKMYEVGGVLSEWNLGVQNHPGLFPIRNRLISALSDGVFVVEAARRSGTFITVDQALEQGKNVFALPGRVTDHNSTGTNQLIREGAIPVTCVEDIMEQLNIHSPDNNKKRIDMISDEQRKVYDSLDEQNPVEISAIMGKTGYDIGRLIHILYELEMAGWVYQPQQNVYLKKIFLARENEIVYD